MLALPPAKVENHRNWDGPQREASYFLLRKRNAYQRARHGTYGERPFNSQKRIFDWHVGNMPNRPNVRNGS